MECRGFLSGVTAEFVFTAAGTSISLGSHRNLEGHVTVSIYYKTLGTTPNIDNVLPIDGSVVWQCGVEDCGNSWFKLWRTHINYEGQKIVFETPDADTSEEPRWPEITYPDDTAYIETTTLNNGERDARPG